ncbi:MAG: SCP2 sterol-binding domain-containing protein [Candidatus Competibacter sp.]|nr:SCP2 sterol-binding domain-containing protein [Candidatus Competibacter sp.]MDG4585305.1 SCP2 sterol-binding domain-containing protein [Candidatus Competibacter sp.]
MTPTAIAASLETVLNLALRLDPEVFPRLGALSGHVIAIEPSGMAMTFYLLPKPDGIQVTGRCETKPSVRIRATPAALFRQWRGQRVGGDEIAIEGNAGVGREFQAVLARLDIDWEEHLSRVVGDVVARRLGGLWGGLRAWSGRTGDVLLRDGGEYVQRELRLLPPRQAIGQFLHAVDLLREDADRLAARVERLRRRSMVGEPR